MFLDGAFHLTGEPAKRVALGKHTRRSVADRLLQ